DIIIRSATVANPQTAFGAGSGQENSVNLSQTVRTGHDSYIYIRMQNRGSVPATNVDVNLYWSPSSTLITPAMWHPVGSVRVPSVPTGNVLMVSPSILWPAAQVPPGHYCFIAVAGTVHDEAPNPSAFTTLDQYATFLQRNNNVAMRNFHVVDRQLNGPYQAGFIVPGWFDTGHKFRIEGMGKLPVGSTVYVEVPAWLADAMRPHQVPVKYDAKRGTARFPLNPWGTQALGTAYLHAGSVAECRVEVSIPKEHAIYPYEYAVRQMYGDIEVGRVTWLLMPDQKSEPVIPPKKGSKRG
ncbi:MAG: hypothetical protein ABI876_02175, partial [Bacteroidota bacterium]